LLLLLLLWLDPVTSNDVCTVVSLYPFLEAFIVTSNVPVLTPDLSFP
jgi:hypothetical protein